MRGGIQISSILFAVWASLWGANEVLAQENILRDVMVNPTPSQQTIRFEFENEVEEVVGPVFFRRSIQMDVPSARFEAPRHSYPVTLGPISQVYVSESEPGWIRVRFMLDGDNGFDQEGFHFEVEGRFLTIRVGSSVATEDAALDRILARTVKTLQRSKPATKPGAAASPNPVRQRVSRRAKEKPSPPPGTRRKNLVRVAAPAAAKNSPPKIPKTKVSLKRDTPRSAAPTGLMQAGLDGPSGDTMWGTVFKMGSTLAFVVGLMFLLFYGFKKWVLKQGVFGGKQQPIRVISTGFLGPKKSIALVEVANRVLVLGVANDHISLLSSLEDKAEIEDLLKPPPRGKKSPPPESSRRKTAPGKSPQPQAPGLRARQQILRKPNAEKEKGSFQKYVNQFSGTSPKKSRSVEDLTKMIRQQAKKVKSTV